MSSWCFEVVWVICYIIIKYGVAYSWINHSDACWWCFVRMPADLLNLDGPSLIWALATPRAAKATCGPSSCAFNGQTTVAVPNNSPVQYLATLSARPLSFHKCAGSVFLCSIIPISMVVHAKCHMLRVTLCLHVAALSDQKWYKRHFSCFNSFYLSANHFLWLTKWTASWRCCVDYFRGISFAVQQECLWTRNDSQGSFPAEIIVQLCRRMLVSCR